MSRPLESEERAASAAALANEIERERISRARERAAADRAKAVAHEQDLEDRAFSRAKVRALVAARRQSPEDRAAIAVAWDTAAVDRQIARDRARNPDPD